MNPTFPMVRWYQVRRLRGPAFLILVGVLFLLDQWNILGFNKSWPLFLIVAGLLALVERAAWAADAAQQQAAYQPQQPSAGKAQFVPDVPGPTDGQDGPQHGEQP
ncbi:MAG: LiaI-LiaF-like domain-containing protein [Acidobacteriaceae bacterium]